MTEIYNPYESTIAAISTPTGKGGIAVIRISGKESHQVINKIFKAKSNNRFEERKLQYGELVDPINGIRIDEVLCVLMKSPNSYTGEDIAEIHSHGGYVIPKKILELLISMGIKPAEPGEFTKRAFLNGKMDLAQAEAVSDVINAQTEKSLAQAENQLKGSLSRKINELKNKLLDIVAEVEAHIDFPEEDLDPILKDRINKSASDILNQLKTLKKTHDTGKIFREGIYTAIIGKPNVGKSSLLNSLINRKRAIVSPYAGTTRDFIEEAVDVLGIPLRIVDTAGIRKTTDKIETVGIDMAKQKAAEAELLLVILDQSEKMDENDFELLKEIKGKNYLIVLNKSDCKTKIDKNIVLEQFPKEFVVESSAIKDGGIEKLKKKIYETVTGSTELLDSEVVLLTKLRHKKLVENSIEYLKSFIKLLKKNESPEFLSLDIRTSMNFLAEITGEVTTEDILGKIFSKFCIGK